VHPPGLSCNSWENISSYSLLSVSSVHCLQETHQLYKQKLEEVFSLQDKCSLSIAQQRKKLRDVSLLLSKCRRGLSSEDVGTADKIQGLIKDRPNIFFEMEAFLPKKNGMCLNLVLGNVNVTLLSKQSKFAYKDEYEKFKLCLTVFHLLLACMCRFFVSNRIVDALFNFLLVWYYSTLTIRESILISNGSRIKGWWVLHHYISAFLSGVILTWPDGNLYQVFRNQFLSYSLYQSLVHLLQYYYQRGCLYRLRSLGERHNMDLTVEKMGMWCMQGNGALCFTTCLFQLWQLYNGLSLFRMAHLPECTEWQVTVCGATFLVLFIGNFSTTLAVVYQKFQNKNQAKFKNL
uniref:Transmembrane protein 120Ab n=1 Tax=Scleropages formosus TaxID=113540 RepID=A0A8C9TV78_SCLFO